MTLFFIDFTFRNEMNLNGESVRLGQRRNRCEEYH